MSAPRMMPTVALALHADAALVPEMPPDQYAAFLADVRARGILTPIEVIPGTKTVIEGRTRLKAATEAGLPAVPVVDADLRGDTQVVYMIRAALLRRQLTSGQRAALAVELETQLAKVAKERQREGGKRGGSAPAADPRKVVERIPQPSAPAPKARDTAAAIAGSNPRYVSDAKALKASAPAVFDQVKAGTLTLPEAKRATAKPSGFVAVEPPARPALVSVVGGAPDARRAAAVTPATDPLARLAAELEETASWLTERADVLLKLVEGVSARVRGPLQVEVARIRGRADLIRQTVRAAKGGAA